MFARLYVLLPFTAIVRPDDEFSLIDAEEGGFTFTILPPYKARLMPADLHFAYGIPMLERPDRLTPMLAPPTPVHLDDRPAILADALAVDIRGEGLTRASGVQVEPALPVAFDVVNDFLERLRVISEGHHIQPISLEMGTIWLLVYIGQTTAADRGFAMKPHASHLFRSWAIVRLVSHLPRVVQLPRFSTGRHSRSWRHSWSTGSLLASVGGA